MKDEGIEPSKDVLANNPKNIASDNVEKKELKKTPITPEMSANSPTLTPTPATTTRSNGSCSDASLSSELEALLPPVDHFKEEERTQWEPLSAEKFSRQKNTPRYKLQYNHSSYS